MATLLNVWTLLTALVLALLTNAVFNLYLHRLRQYPGPRHAAVSRFWYSFKVLGGHHKYWIQRLHDEYGPVVRIAPSELSYIDPRAWEDIYGKSAHENKGASLEKESDFFKPAFNNSDSLVDASSTGFKPQKKNATRAFSHGSLLQRSHVMTAYIDQSIKLLTAYLGDEQEQTIDINPWLGNIVLDNHTKMTMSRDFAAVDLGPKAHPVVSNMHKAVTAIQYSTQLQYLPAALTFVTKLIPSRDIFTVLGNVPPLGPAIRERIAEEKDSAMQQDFVSHMLQDGDGDVQNAATVQKNAIIFILSAVETLPGYVCSILYYLLETPRYFEAVRDEVRTAFADSDEITLKSTQELEFLKVCMREGLRVSPPAVGTLTRRIPRDGAEVCGRFVPGDITVGIHNWSITHSARYWKDPDKFRPERWTGDKAYEEDQKVVFNPFGVGPRTCVARHLVTLEATLIIAKLVYAFDMTMDPSSCGDWPVHRGHFVPTRGSLFLRLHPVGKV